MSLKGPYKRDGASINNGVGDPIARVSWGCGCCEGPLLEDEIAEGDSIVHCLNSHTALVEALEKAIEIIEAIPLTVRQVIENDMIRDISGINPYCMNEGLAMGDESYTLSTWKLREVLTQAKGGA